MTWVRPRAVGWRQAAALALAALALAGCSLGPRFQKPRVATPATWQTAPAAAAWPSADWWRGFGSPELDTLMAQAQAANTDIAAAVARVREADAQTRIAGAPLLPSISAGGSIERTRSSKVASGDRVLSATASTIINPEVTVSYQLDFWGKNQASLEAAQALARSSRYSQQTVALTVEAGVASTYFAILALTDRLAVTQANLASANEVLNALREEQTVGTATALDVAQQETVVATLEAEVPPLVQQLQQNKDALAILLGRTPEALGRIGGTLAAMAQPTVAPGLPSELLARRPDVAAAEAQLMSANANIRVARAAYFPDITLTAAGGVASVALNGLVGPAGAIYTLAAGVTQPIFEGGALQGQVELTRAQYDELLANYRKAVISAFGNVEDALVAAQQTALQVARQQVAVDKARRAYEISKAQLEAGTVNLLTVLNTENALFPAQDALVQAKLARLQALVTLFQALGGGWQQQS